MKTFSKKRRDAENAEQLKVWTAVAERSGDTAFASHSNIQKRCGAALPTAVQNDFLHALRASAFLRHHS